MEIKFPYGKGHLSFSIDDEIQIDIVRADVEIPIEDSSGEIEKALKSPKYSKPLSSILKNRQKDRVCIVISDSTRPVPSGTIIKPILHECEIAGIHDDEIDILIATGLHRKTRPDELRDMLGDEIIERYNIINHVADDINSLEYLGESSYGTPIYINKHYLNAGIKILTGYVEPHFFAGFSGGRKSVVPGIAGEETILANHSPRNIDSPNARFGILKDNPVYEDAQEIVKMKGVRPDFVVNVCINPEHKITKVAAGGLQIHNELVQYQEKLAFFKLEKPYDVVIVTNGGSPLDLNLYQAVKSMAIGELGVKQGGTIIAINECRDGVGQPKFEELINMDLTPEQMYQKILSREIKCKDSWEIQVLSRVLMKADVYVISEIPEDNLGKIGLKYADNVESVIEKCRQKYGPDMRVLALPDGPMKIPKI